MPANSAIWTDAIHEITVVSVESEVHAMLEKWSLEHCGMGFEQLTWVERRSLIFLAVNTLTESAIALDSVRPQENNGPFKN